MTFSAVGSEIPKLFVEVFHKTFGLRFEDYLTNEGRGFIAVVISNENPAGLLAARSGLDEQPASALLGDVMKGSRFDGFGAYFTPTRFLKAPFAHDVLLIQQRWLDLDSRGRTAIAFHEACHCFRDSKLFGGISETSVAFRGGKYYRRFTQYHDSDDFGHDPQWFALLSEKAEVLQSGYSNLFASGHAVIESALCGDIRLSEGEVLPEYKPEAAA